MFDMAATKQLAAVARNGIGKGAARSVRRDGRVPGVIYGGGEAPEPISVDFKDLNKLVYAGHFLTTIFELDLAGRKERVLPRDYQLDVVNDRPLHVDFLRLKAGSRVRIQTPVHVIEQELSPGVKKGGAVNIVLHSLELWAPADAIPEFGHDQSRRSRFPRFRACLDHHAAGRLQAGERQDRSDDRHGGAAHRLQGRGAGGGRRDLRRPRCRRCHARRGRRRREGRARSGQGRRGAGQGRRRARQGARSQEVTSGARRSRSGPARLREPSTTELLVTTLDRLGLRNTRGASKFDRVLSAHNKLADALNDCRNETARSRTGRTVSLMLWQGIM